VVRFTILKVNIPDLRFVVIFPNVCFLPVMDSIGNFCCWARNQALYNYIEQMFDLGVSKIEIKRKDFQEVSGVSSTKDLDEYITAQMRGKRQLIFRISW